MSEFIDKIELIQAIDEEINNAETKYEADIMFKIKDIVQNQYVFDLLKDLKPVKRGKWRFTEKLILGNPYGSYQCSECMYRVPYEENYCSNCGADMREENKNE